VILGVGVAVCLPLSAHRVVIFVIAQLSCYIFFYCNASKTNSGLCVCFSNKVGETKGWDWGDNCRWNNTAAGWAWPTSAD